MAYLCQGIHCVEFCGAAMAAAILSRSVAVVDVKSKAGGTYFMAIGLLHTSWGLCHLSFGIVFARVADAESQVLFGKLLWFAFWNLCAETLSCLSNKMACVLVVRVLLACACSCDWVAVCEGARVSAGVQLAVVEPRRCFFLRTFCSAGIGMVARGMFFC